MVKDLSNIIKDDIFTSGYIYSLRNSTIKTINIGIRDLYNYRSDIVSRMISNSLNYLPGLLILGEDTTKENSFNTELIEPSEIPESSFTSNSISDKYFK